MVSHQIVLLGSVVSKKNSNKVSCAGGYPRIYKTPDFEAWHESCLWQLKGKPKFDSLSELSMTFFYKDKRRHDLDNSAASICDLLVDASILPDDSVKEIPVLTLRYGGVDKSNPRCEIKISTV